MKHSRFLLAAILVLVAVPCMAQVVATPQSRLGWDQEAADLAEAQSLTANLYVEGQVGAPIVLAGKICNAGTGTAFFCAATLPPFTSGLHTVRLTVGLAGMESAPSDPLTFRVVIVQTPKGLKIVSIWHPVEMTLNTQQTLRG